MARRNRPNRPGSNPYTGNTGTTATGGGQGVTRNRGGGGGGRGRPKKPQGGLYGGKAGEATSNQDPEQFFTSLLSQSGLYGNTGSAYDDFVRTQLLDRMMRGYNDATDLNQNLSAVDWARQTYGAGFDNDPAFNKRQRKRGKGVGTVFNPGSLGTLNEGIQGLWETNQANDDPLSYFTSRGIDRLVPGAAGNSQFTNFLNSQYLPQVASEFNLAQGQTPALNANDWWTQNQQRIVGGAQGAFDTFRSNENPMGWAVQQAGARGLMPSNGNQQFADFYQNAFAPRLQREFETARTGNANLNFNSWLANRDLVGEARRAFANRAPQFRAPSPNAPSGGRWSWWA